MASIPKLQIEILCEAHADSLVAPFLPDKKLFLYALSGVESSFGAQNIPRFEPNFGPDGIYFKKSKLLKALYETHGAMASCSVSPWQIMYCTAVELGYNGAPEELHNDCGEALTWVVALLNQKVLKLKADTLEKLALAYNHGDFRPYNTITDPYVKRFHLFYDPMIKGILTS